MCYQLLCASVSDYYYSLKCFCVIVVSTSWSGVSSRGKQNTVNYWQTPVGALYQAYYICSFYYVWYLLQSLSSSCLSRCEITDSSHPLFSINMLVGILVSSAVYEKDYIVYYKSVSDCMPLIVHMLVIKILELI